MPEYSIGFAQEMSKASNAIVDAGFDSVDAQRAVLYIGLVSCEIAIKAALEKAGIPIVKVKASHHNLATLLKLLGTCSVLLADSQRRVSATCIRSIVVNDAYVNATIGNLLEAENLGASRFPNEVRYGDFLEHYPAALIACLSRKVVDWVNLHNDHIEAPI